MNDCCGILPLYGRPEIVLEKTEACCVFDQHGGRYVDFESGVWAANLGHNHEAMAEALRRSLSGAFHHGYRFRNPESEALSDKLNALCAFPGGQSVFLSSGSEAVNLGLVIARHCTKREKIVRVGNSYLSAYGFGRLAEDNPDRIDLAGDDLAGIERVDWSSVAAVALELGGASIDVVSFPNEAFIRRLCECARTRGSLILADEVTTGFGRTGKWFGYQHYGIKPDAVVTGKALGNGYPVSAVTVSGNIARVIDAQPMRYAQSHQNDPAGCAVANAVIDHFLAHDIVSLGQATGLYFLDQLARLQNKFPRQIAEIRGRGLMLALQLHDETTALHIANGLFDDGFIVGHRGASLRFMPPLVITRDMIDALIEQLMKRLGM